jgi:hypothetical protein
MKIQTVIKFGLLTLGWFFSNEQKASAQEGVTVPLTITAAGQWVFISGSVNNNFNSVQDAAESLAWIPRAHE